MTNNEQVEFDKGYMNVYEAYNSGVTTAQLHKEIMYNTKNNDNNLIIAFGNGAMTALLEIIERKIH